MKRVLIVDDKEDNLYYLRKLLESDGCVVESAHHGAEALLKARTTTPDLVISDLLMPVMDGYTLLRHWKLDPVLSQVPFVVYTATYTSPEDEQLALDLGADAFILKPSEPQDFLARIAALRRNEQARIPAPPRRPVGDDDVHLREYSEVLIRKLEAKSLELEETNRSLQLDIQMRAGVEEALRESEERFRILIEGIPQLVWMAGPDGRSIFTNRRWREYTGLAEEITWLQAVHPDDGEALRDAWERASSSSIELDTEIRLLRHDGAARWFLVRAIPMRDASGSIARWLGTSTDIHDLKTAQQQLLDTEEQLRQAQKMEAIGRLAAGVAHDFNNLLSVILTYASLILEDVPETASMRPDLEEIHRAGHRATDLTRQLLAFSRQQVLQPRVLDLSATVRAMEKMLRRIVAEDVAISIVDVPHAGRVYADPSQIEQIVMNLVVNARDAMPRGGRITIETAAHVIEEAGPVEPGAYIVLRITDTGVGMTPDVAARVFEPFFTTKDVGKGTGLGLSTVFGIVKQSGGHITLDTRPGEGTTFAVYLPRTDRAVEPDQPPMSASARTGTETVLVVEDDEQVRALSAAILRRNGYTVLDAANAGEALAHLRQARRPHSTAGDGRRHAADERMRAGRALGRTALAHARAVRVRLQRRPDRRPRRARLRARPGPEADHTGRPVTQDPRSTRFSLTVGPQKIRKAVELKVMAGGESGDRRDPRHLELLEACVARLRDCVIIAEVDGDGRPVIVYVNDAFVERTGYARHEVIGSTPAILHGPRTDPETVARIVRALVTGQPHREEILSYTKQGEPVWFELDVAPVTDETGKVTHWISVERDITHRKAVEEDLRRSEEQYRLLFANNPMPMWAYDIETLRFSAVNDAAIAHYGYTREQFLAMTIADIRPDEDVARLHRAIHAENVGLGKSGIWRHRTADGRILHVDISSHKMRLDGRTVRVVLANDISRELLALEALRSSEASLARAQRIAHLGSWEVELATNALSWSDEIYRIFDIAHDEFGATYEAFLARVHPDDREAMHQAHVNARSGRCKLDLEHRIVRTDGGVSWVHELGELELDGAGTPVRLTGTVLDITERKRDELRQAVERQVLEVITAGRPLDESLDEIVRALETLEPKVSAHVLRPGAPVPNGCAHVFPVCANDARVVAKLAIDGCDGAELGAGHVNLFERIRDLVAIAFEREAVQSELRSSEERFRLLATGTNDAVWDYDVDTGILWWGDGVTRLFGIDRNELEPALASWTRQIHPDDEKRIVDAFQAALDADVSSWSDEYRFLRADGSYASVLDRGHIIRDAAGKAVRVIGGIMDMTQQKELERQLLRTQRLEGIGTLAGGVAHDLNNVLQPILIEVEGLRDTALAAGRIDHLLTIEHCAQRGAALVRQLVSFARGTEVPRSPLDLSQVAADLRKMIRDTFPKNIEPAMYVAPKLRRVRANATELHQVLLNLCVNARDAMPEGGSLRISFMNHDVSELPKHRLGFATPGRHVVIEVSDSGTGMPGEIIERIFDPFFTTKEPGRGTGLGLAATHAIVRSHRGFLTVESTPGAGSTFRVFLPSTDDVPVLAAPQVAAINGTGQTILVIDDESHIRAATRRILERHGYRAITAATSREALEVCVRERISAVVLDLAMPDLDGTATALALAKLDPLLPVIGASGLATPEFVNAVRCFLPKPYTTQELLGAVAGVIAPG